MSNKIFETVGRDRLLALADELHLADAWHRKKGEPTYDQSAIMHECGTPACAIGHYAAMTPKKFSIKEVDAFSIWSYKTFIVKRSGRGLDYHSRIVLNEFGITLSEAEELFGPHGCGNAQNAKAAAKYLRGFCARKSVCEYKPKFANFGDAEEKLEEKYGG